MRVIGKDGYIPGVGLFYEITDEQLERVRVDPKYYLDFEFVGECTQSRGDNAHVFGLFSDRKEVTASIILKHQSNMLKEYKTVSWWDRDNNKFRLLRR